jgi:glycerol-3-phosphate dehydrogenase
MHLPKVAAETTEEIMTYILSKSKQLVPSFDASQVIHTFSGARAKNSTGDWIIGPSRAHPFFINAAGIDSPGLAGSPAIAIDVVKMLQKAGE